MTTTTASDKATQSSVPRGETSHRSAAVVSEVLAPWVFAAAMPPVVGAMTTEPWWHGFLIGLLVTTLTAVIPYGVIQVRVRSGQYSDRHLVRREDRPKFLGMVVGLTVLALVLVRVLDGSWVLQGFVVLVLVTAALGAVVSRWWKISMHTLVMSASLVTLISLDERLVPLTALLPLVIWARLRLRVHSPAQLLAGTAAGTALGLTAMLLT